MKSPLSLFLSFALLLSLSNPHSFEGIPSSSSVLLALSLFQSSSLALPFTMLFKNSLLLATALTAGSAVARLHGHQRRHAHPQPGFNNQLQPESPATPVADGSLIDDVLNVRGFDNQLSPETPASPVTDNALLDDLNVRQFNNQLQPETPAAPVADGSLVGDVLNVRGFDNQLEPVAPNPAVTDAPTVDALNARAVGQTVTAEINGVMETWINNWAGQVAASTSSSTTTAAAPTIPPPPPPAPTESSTQAAPTQAPPAPAPSSSGSIWSDTPANGVFSRSGFGGSNYNIQVLGISWSGNTGVPWGSNIIEVAEADAHLYQFVARFEGSQSAPWTVLFWNKMGPSGQMDGFFSPNQALSITLAPNEVKYVAFDVESTGGWAAFPGDVAPLSSYGSYAATWGEFTMRAAPNFSSWDVSCIQAQNAGKTIQGMKICTHDGQGCSAITNGLGSVENAYTAAQTNVNGIGGNVMVDALRLLVNIDHA